MNDFVKILRHARRLNSATKSLSVAELKDIQNKLETIIEKRIVAEEDLLRNEAEKKKKIEDIKKQLAADGINLNELLTESTEKVTKKRAPRPPKYAITNEEGKKITWTGQGRMPNVFKEKVAEGVSIDTFLIK
jgi:DNA-binding protein H-NS